jgi:hypothetical protein
MRGKGHPLCPHSLGEGVLSRGELRALLDFDAWLFGIGMGPGMEPRSTKNASWGVVAREAGWLSSLATTLASPPPRGTPEGSLSFPVTRPPHCQMV